MENYLIFDEQELVRIGAVCPDCGTEAIFDLTKDQAAHRPRVCPGCDAELVEQFQTEAKQTYNWITYYKRGRDTKKRPRLLFYFKRP